MMAAIHWLRCPHCHRLEREVAVSGGLMPKCERCGTHMRITWEHGKPPGTDVLGREHTSEVLDDPATGKPLTWTSSRERDAKMRAGGWEPVGDKEGGARNESHMRLGKKFFGDGMKPSQNERPTWHQRR